jgi:hypothetical protein
MTDLSNLRIFVCTSPINPREIAVGLERFRSSQL